MENLQTQGIAPAAAWARHLSPAGRCLPRGGRKRARRSATAISTPPKCTATRRRSARRSPPPASPASDLHVTTKVWNENLAPDAIRRAFDASLKKLGLDHVDLYLVHWPARDMNLPAMFETLMKLKQEGRTRAIGVANFNIALLKTVVEEIKAPDRLQPGRISRDARPDAVAPISRRQIDSAGGLLPAGAGPRGVRRDADSDRPQAGASAAQVALKWLLDQDGVAAIPKASRAESQQANLDALKIGLDDEDLKAIAALPKDRRCVNPGFAPAWD